MRQARRGLAQQAKRPASDEQAEAASYVAALAADLAVIARRHGLDTLGHILEMARLEAENISGSAPGPLPSGGS